MDYESQIKEILQHFDFDKVQRVMKLLDWRWTFIENEVPNHYQLIECAKKLLNEVASDDKKDHYYGTGGFLAENNHGLLTLAFNVSRWDIERD